MGVKRDNSVRLWEQDRQMPDIERLGRVLGVRHEWLATGEEPMLPPALVDREQLDRMESLLAQIGEKLGVTSPVQPGQVSPAVQVARLRQEDRDVEDDQADEAQPG